MSQELSGLHKLITANEYLHSVRQTLSGFNLTMSDFLVGNALLQGCRFPNEISKTASMSAPLVSTAMGRLLKKAFVENVRDDHDRRRHAYVLSLEGKTAVTKAIVSLNQQAVKGEK